MLFRFCNRELSDLNSEINRINSATDDVFRRSELAVRQCQKAIGAVRKNLQTHKFLHKSEEITFFKQWKPRFVSLLIYYLNIYNIEINKPNGPSEDIRNYLRFELGKLKRYFDENIDFYRYYRAGSTHLDTLYFTRGELDISLNLESYVYESDPNFCTSHDFKVSKLLAHELLQQHLENELAKLENESFSNTNTSPPGNTLTWTGSKVALTELLYGLYSSGVFNHGNADIKTIATHFEKTFNIDLGKFYRIYTELRMRQDQTKFLDDMKNSLVRKMEEDDEK